MIEIIKKKKKILLIIAFCFACIIFSRLLYYSVFRDYRDNNSFKDYIMEYNKWDAPWYPLIMENGYKYEEVHVCAFFPMQALLLKVFTFVLHTQWELAGPIMNTILLCISSTIAFLYIQETRNFKQAVLYVLLITFGMYTFYFSSTYTESLYLLCVVVFFYSLRKRKYLIMGISGAIASATRNTGIFLVFAVIPHLISLYREADKQEPFSLKAFFEFLLEQYQLILGTCLVPLGLFSYILYQYLVIGDGLAFVHAQIVYRPTETYGGGFLILFHGLQNVLENDYYLSLWTIFAIICVWFLFKQKRFEEMIVLLIWLLIPLSLSLMSIPRFMMGSFFPLVCFTDFLKKCSKLELLFIFSIIIIMGSGLYMLWLNEEYILV